MAESQVRIFVSSPADLDHERALIKDIIDQLAQEYLPYFKLQAILWEEEALTAAQSFQAGLVRPAECELVLVMLWTRLGTPLADDPYGGMTGTEWEFVDAVEAFARKGGPEVLVYKKTTPRLIDITNALATHEAVADRERLEAFFRTHFFNADGSFRRAFRQFDSDRGLRELVEGQLRKLLNRRISVERGQRPGAGEWRESPFRADEPYALGDEPVFVGRETETRELVARLDAQRGDGRGLVLITGPAGVGKSSLVRAGLLPRLVRPFLFAGVAGCRWCLLTGDDPDPLAALVRALRLPAILGATLDGFGLDQAGLERLLATAPAVAAGQVQAALARVVGDAGQPAGSLEGRQQLALILDPLDGLFTPTALADPRTQTYAAALAALAAQDGIWVVATLRSDLLRQVPRIPALAGLLDEQSWYPLEPPPAARIRQVLEIPARVAGIEYEGEGGGAGRGLVDLLEAETSHLAHWPTLLEPVLTELYDRAHAQDTDGDAGAANPDPGLPANARDAAPAARLRLRISDYRTLGGVAGTTRRRAETLWEGLDPATRAALPILCRALITLEGGPSARPSPRTGDLRALRRDPACGRLVQALVAARLVVTEAVADPAERLPCAQTDDRLFAAVARLARETREEWRARLAPGRATAALASGAATVAAPVPPAASGGPAAATDWRDFRPTASFIHQTLIDTWTPVRDWLADPGNRRDLQLRFQIARQARLWKHTDCNREYLLGEVGYAAARRFAAAFPGELEPVERDFLDRSRAQLRDQRRRNRWARIVGLTLAALLLVASSSAYWARESSRTATLNLHHSQLNAANLAINEGNTPVAIRLALGAGRDLPQAATDTLSRAFSANRLIAMVETGTSALGQPLSPGISDDGNQLVTLTSRDGASLWTLIENRFVFDRPLAPPALPIHAIRFGDGTPPLILGLGETGVWRLPAAADAAPAWPCGVRPGGIIALDPTHRYLALAHPIAGDGFGLCLLDLAQPGSPRWDLPLHQKEIRAVAFSPDGARLITASRDGTARILDTATGNERLTLNPTGPLNRPVNRAIFDSRGEQVAVATTDERVRVYGEDGTERIVLGEVVHEGRRVRIHQSPVRDLTFAVADRYLLAGDDEGQLVRWDLRNGEAEILGQHRLGVERVRIPPLADPRAQDPLVLTASLDQTARLWGIRSGRQLAVFTHEAPISNARFSADGQRVLTYSDQDGSVRVWSVGHATTLAFRLPHEDHVSHLDVARPPKELDADPSAVLIASGGFDGLVRVWRYDAAAPWAPPGEIWHLAGHQGRVRRVAFAPSARQLASAAYDGTARVWDLVTGGGCTLEPTPDAGPGADTTPAAARPASTPGPQTSTATPPATEFYRVVFGPAEHWLLTTANDLGAPVRLWDPAACRELPLPKALEHGATKVQAATATATADGTQLAATGDDAGTLRVAAQAPDGTWAPRCHRQPHQAPIIDLAFAPDGQTLATASEDGQVALVSLTADGCGDPLLLKGGAGALYSVRFAPDGAALVTAAMDGRAQVWDTQGRLLGDLKGHKDRVASAEFSPDGHWLLTAARDGAVRLWRRPPAVPTDADGPPTETSYLVMEGDLGGARIARFTPDGRGVAAAYRQDAVVLWRVWAEDPTPDPALEAQWGPERARLALIREAARFKRDNGLDAPVAGE